MQAKADGVNISRAYFAALDAGQAIDDTFGTNVLVYDRMSNHV